MSYDLIVIGTGPGGYVCAIRAAQLGLKTAVVEKRKTQGGTCLNVGCIPSKALLHASHAFEDAKHHFGDLGIQVGEATLDLSKMMAFKDEGVEGNVKGVEFLLKKNKVDMFHGTARIAAVGQVEVVGEDGSNQVLETKNIVIATGSDVAALPGVDIDEKIVVSSTGALELGAVPNMFLVIGAGVIGLELGSVWRRLGSRCWWSNTSTASCRAWTTRSGASSSASSKSRVFSSNSRPRSRRSRRTGRARPSRSSRRRAEALRRSRPTPCWSSIGRVPYTEGLGLEHVGVQKDNKGRILTDAHFATNVTGIYAIGDVIAGPMLAHKAEDEGVAVAEILAGRAGHVNYDVIPNVVYTFPEVASVGKTEEELKQDGVAYKVGKFPFTANGRAKVNRTTDGFVKILADATTDRVLGVHIVGPEAGNLVMECAVAMEFGASSEDIARTCHAHPTLTEAVKEAALAVEKRAIHM